MAFEFSRGKNVENDSQTANKVELPVKNYPGIEKDRKIVEDLKKSCQRYGEVDWEKLPQALKKMDSQKMQPIVRFLKHEIIYQINNYKRSYEELFSCHSTEALNSSKSSSWGSSTHKSPWQMFRKSLAFSKESKEARKPNLSHLDHHLILDDLDELSQNTKFFEFLLNSFSSSVSQSDHAEFQYWERKVKENIDFIKKEANQLFENSSLENVYSERTSFIAEVAKERLEPSLPKIQISSNIDSSSQSVSSSKQINDIGAKSFEEVTDFFNQLKKQNSPERKSLNKGLENSQSPANTVGTPVDFKEIDDNKPLKKEIQLEERNCQVIEQKRKRVCNLINECRSDGKVRWDKLQEIIKKMEPNEVQSIVSYLRDEIDYQRESYEKEYNDNFCFSSKEVEKLVSLLLSIQQLFEDLKQMAEHTKLFGMVANSFPDFVSQHQNSNFIKRAAEQLLKESQSFSPEVYYAEGISSFAEVANYILEATRFNEQLSSKKVASLIQFQEKSLTQIESLNKQIELLNKNSFLEYKKIKILINLTGFLLQQEKEMSNEFKIVLDLNEKPNDSSILLAWYKAEVGLYLNQEKLLPLREELLLQIQQRLLALQDWLSKEEDFFLKKEEELLEIETNFQSVAQYFPSGEQKTQYKAYLSQYLGPQQEVLRQKDISSNELATICDQKKHELEERESSLLLQKAEFAKLKEKLFQEVDSRGSWFSGYTLFSESGSQRKEVNETELEFFKKEIASLIQIQEKIKTREESLNEQVRDLAQLQYHNKKTQELANLIDDYFRLEDEVGQDTQSLLKQGNKLVKLNMQLKFYELLIDLCSKQENFLTLREKLLLQVEPWLSELKTQLSRADDQHSEVPSQVVSQSEASRSPRIFGKKPNETLLQQEKWEHRKKVFVINFPYNEQFIKKIKDIHTQQKKHLAQLKEQLLKRVNPPKGGWF